MATLLSWTTQPLWCCLQIYLSVTSQQSGSCQQHMNSSQTQSAGYKIDKLINEKKLLWIVLVIFQCRDVASTEHWLKFFPLGSLISVIFFFNLFMVEFVWLPLSQHRLNTHPQVEEYVTFPNIMSVKSKISRIPHHKKFPESFQIELYHIHWTELL